MRSWEEWSFRPRVLGRALWLPHLYTFLLGLAVSLAIPFFVAWYVPGLDVGSHLRMSGGFLQLGGIGTIVLDLWNRGIAFERLHPLQALRGFFKRLSSAFRKPSGVTLNVPPLTFDISGSDAQTFVEKAASTLDERVEALERRAENTEAAMKDLRREHREEVEDLKKKLGQVRQELKKEIAKLKGQVENAFVEGTPWEWVGVSWLLLGIVATVISEWPV